MTNDELTKRTNRRRAAQKAAATRRANRNRPTSALRDTAGNASVLAAAAFERMVDACKAEGLDLGVGFIESGRQMFADVGAMIDARNELRAETAFEAR